MLGRQWNKKRVRSLHLTFTEVWIKKFYITIPIFFIVWSFKIPYMVYEMLFASILSFVYADKIIDKIKWWTKDRKQK